MICYWNLCFSVSLLTLHLLSGMATMQNTPSAIFWVVGKFLRLMATAQICLRKCRSIPESLGERGQVPEPSCLGVEWHFYVAVAILVRLAKGFLAAFPVVVPPPPRFGARLSLSWLMQVCTGNHWPHLPFPSAFCFLLTGPMCCRFPAEFSGKPHHWARQRRASRSLCWPQFWGCSPCDDETGPRSW